MTRLRIVHLLVMAPLLGMTVLGSGCVSTALERSVNHPARPEAAAGVGADPGTVLLADAALYATPAPPAAVGEAAQAQEPDGTRENPYVGRGVIQDVENGALIIDHEAIPGFMGAMTMAYPVAEEVNVEGLAAGDTVTFRVELPESGGYRIFDVEAAEGEGGGGEDIHNHDAPASQEPPAAPQPRR